MSNSTDSFHSFEEACLYIQNLPYKRNANKSDINCVLNDNGGTCSTKHAFLKCFADKQSIEDVKLMLGIFRMNSINTSKIGEVLKTYNLIEMPEAHNYLKIDGKIHDYTRRNSKPEDFVDDLLVEIEIQPNQITDFKVEYHQNFLKQYLDENPSIPYNEKEFWNIREECIAALQK